MAALLTIGEFSRMTHVSVKALRHYHDVGLLEPADVDPATGYRFYATAQVPTALLIRRFRELDMPLEDIKGVLDAPDVTARDELIIGHLGRMEQQLEQTAAAVQSLRALLEGRGGSIAVEYRTADESPSLAVRERVAWDDTPKWLWESVAALRDVIGTGRGESVGPAGALYSPEFFESHVGEVVAFIPVRPGATGWGKVKPLQLPAMRLAVTVHDGPFGDLDQAYGALGTFVAEHAIGIDGPIRENYFGMSADPNDQELVTEVCWPIRSVPGGER